LKSSAIDPSILSEIITFKQDLCQEDRQADSWHNELIWFDIYGRNTKKVP
jgi:hypothetical protein